ncbi:MAG: hypothetical protein KIS73_25090 [Enhydrobacter sp.]|nr:hypothetical protein [Enhydrobacter sp.]
MSIQLPLPGSWPRNMSWRDPNAELEQLAKDKLDAKAEIYAVMERLANKHCIPLPEVHGVMLGYVDDALGDLTFRREEELARERDEAGDIC